ncbi:MAG: amidohydrolase [Chloroflexota bacterium]
MPALRESADLALLNGNVLTLDRAGATAQALAIRDGEIVAIGDNAAVQPFIAGDTRVVDLGGRTAMPGVVDCHVHLASDAAVDQAVEVRDFYTEVHSVRDILHRMRQASINTPAGEWIVGRGCPMQSYRLDERRLPTKDELDEFVPMHPSFVSFGAHVLVANTQALQDKGITRDTPDPQGGTVVKDETSGEPTGVLLERAQHLVKQRATGRDPEVLSESILIELEKCLQRGVTGIHDIIVSRNEVMAYQRLRQQNRLPVRVQMIIRVIESGFQRESLRDIGIMSGFGDSMLKIGGIKMSIDGGFTGKNAAFSEKLDDEPCNRGLIRINQDELDETVMMYHEQGLRVCVHAIGDVALDMILSSHQKAMAAHPRRGLRHRIEHMGNWMCTPERLQIAKEVDVIPVPNPAFLHYLTHEIQASLGHWRTEDAFPFRRLIDDGFPLAFGSDAPGYWPVDPLRDAGAASSHTAYNAIEISPEGRITPYEALRGATATAAYLGFDEGRLGTLEVGKLADVAILQEDPLKTSPTEWGKVPVDMTIVNGQVAYERK